MRSILELANKITDDWHDDNFGELESDSLALAWLIKEQSKANNTPASDLLTLCRKIWAKSANHEKLTFEECVQLKHAVDRVESGIDNTPAETTPKTPPVNVIAFEDKEYFIEVSRDTKDDTLYIAMTETVDSAEKRGSSSPETYDFNEVVM